MKTYIAIFEVPDDYEPADEYTSAFSSTANCDGWFVSIAGTHKVKTKLTEVSHHTIIDEED